MITLSLQIEIDAYDRGVQHYEENQVDDTNPPDDDNRMNVKRCVVDLTVERRRSQPETAQYQIRPSVVGRQTGVCDRFLFCSWRTQSSRPSDLRTKR